MFCYSKEDRHKHLEKGILDLRCYYKNGIPWQRIWKKNDVADTGLSEIQENKTS